MKADHAAVGNVLADRRRFIVPVYQRHYKWNVEKHLEPFWQDIAAKAEERLAGLATRFDHYMGALIVLDDNVYEPRKVPAVQVVDGQQRLTTFQLFLAAARHVARVRGFDAILRDIEAHLLNGDEARMSDPEVERFKLEPTIFDRDLFQCLVEGDLASIQKAQPLAFYKNGKLKWGSAAKPLAAFIFFRDQINGFIESDQGAQDDQATYQAERLSTLISTLLADFRLVVITLQATDDAQVIFSTLNARGEPLLAMDLVRNDVFHRAKADGHDQAKLYKTLWSTFEHRFWEAEVKQGRFKKPRVEFFLANVMAAETAQEISIGNLFPEWRSFVKSGQGGGVVAELEILTGHAPNYRILTNPVGTTILDQTAKTMAAFDVSTANPLLLRLAKDQGDEDELKRTLDLITAYVIRRAACGLGTKNYNNNFLRLVQAAKDDGPTFDAIWKVMGGWTGEAVRFPTDAEFANALTSAPVYRRLGPARARWLLSRLEIALRTKFDEPTELPSVLEVEHVMPQAWRAKWLLPDGRKAVGVWEPALDEQMSKHALERDAAIDTLGNLTLLASARNISLSNRIFAEKRSEFEKSLLVLNRDIARAAEWNEALIAQRGHRLAAQALKLWPEPTRAETASQAA
ncbi:DUF262 domain-containing protein [Brevundimonas sp.]|uniref:DUF262 domain-containing protein n=1 Tax=Brevundimonas sp. TaxID=1871086 RepID=UPI0025C58D4F|nr:DUF262 domain-containing protein [Brevundimonas sp.]